MRDALADDARGPEEAALDVRQVHRAAVALADPRLAAVDLRHHRLRVGAERDRVAVAAVRRRELVVGPQRGERADDGRLGAVGEMRVAADHAGVLLERALHPLLELADAHHLREHPDQPFLSQAVLRHRRSFLVRAASCALVVSYARSKICSMGRLRSSSESTSTPQGPSYPSSRQTATYSAIGELALTGKPAAVDHLVEPVLGVLVRAVAELDPGHEPRRDAAQVVGLEPQLAEVPRVEREAAVRRVRALDDRERRVDVVHLTSYGMNS